jgi:hypothetical protein
MLRKGVQMSRSTRGLALAALAPVALSVMLALASRPAAAQALPRFDVKRTCAADKAAQNAIPDPDCLGQEENARQQLQAIWGQTKPQARATCLGSDADSPLKSYVDVLTCVQMFKDAAP